MQELGVNQIDSSDNLPIVHQEHALISLATKKPMPFFVLATSILEQ